MHRKRVASNNEIEAAAQHSILNRAASFHYPLTAVFPPFLPPTVWRQIRRLLYTPYPQSLVYVYSLKRVHVHVWHSRTHVISRLFRVFCFAPPTCVHNDESLVETIRRCTLRKETSLLRGAGAVPMANNYGMYDTPGDDARTADAPNYPWYAR